MNCVFFISFLLINSKIYTWRGVLEQSFCLLKSILSVGTTTYITNLHYVIRRRRVWQKLEVNYGDIGIGNCSVLGINSRVFLCQLHHLFKSFLSFSKFTSTNRPGTIQNNHNIFNASWSFSTSKWKFPRDAQKVSQELSCSFVWGRNRLKRCEWNFKIIMIFYALLVV